jgi:hypothetical protein
MSYLTLPTPFQTLSRSRSDQRVRTYAGILVAAALGAADARADFFIHHWENRHASTQQLRLLAEGSYYQSALNFNSLGASVAATGLQRLGRIQTDLNLDYGLNARATLFARVTWARTELVSSAPAIGFGFSDQTVGLNLRLWERKSGTQLRHGPAFDLQIQTDFPIYNNTAAAEAGTPFLGDGSTDVSGGLFAAFPVYQTGTDALLLHGGAGYTFRTAGFSSQIPWSVQIEYDRTRSGLSAKGGVYGVTSLQTDGQARAQGGLGAGGNFLINAINPSLVTIKGTVAYFITPQFGLQVAASQALWGQNAPNGLQLFGGIQWRMGPEHRSSGFDRHSPDLSDPSDRFVTYNLEAKVTRASDRFNLFRIDKGHDEGVETGQYFDIYRSLPNASNKREELVARARVNRSGDKEADLTITEYFREILIDEGFSARRLSH